MEVVLTITDTFDGRCRHSVCVVKPVETGHPAFNGGDVQKYKRRAALLVGELGLMLALTDVGGGSPALDTT